jgi:hypothetical protein
LILVAPRDKFSTSEFDALKAFVAEGGSLLISMTEGGEAALGTNINYLTEEFGIETQADAVVRAVYHKYPHPKEVYIQGGVLSSALEQAHGARPIHTSKGPRGVGGVEGEGGRGEKEGCRHDYAHPKEVYIQGGVLSSALEQAHGARPIHTSTLPHALGRRKGG